MKRCSYCGKKINGSVGFCSDACESRYKKVMEKDGPKVKYFISGIILGFLVMFYGIISNSSFLIGMGSIVIGIDVVFFPFTTPETTAFLGYQKAKLVGRVAGIFLIAVGIWVGTKLATTSSTGGLLLALQRAIVTARPKGRYRKHFCWPAIKRYYSNLLVSILLLALLYTFELLHLLYCQSFQHNIL